MKRLQKSFNCMLVGMTSVVFVNSFSTIVCAGSTRRISRARNWPALIGAAILAATSAVIFSNRDLVSHSQDITALVLAGAATDLATASAGHSPAEVFATVVALIGVVTAASGLAALVLDQLRFSFMVTFMSVRCRAGFFPPRYSPVSGAGQYHSPLECQRGSRCTGQAFQASSRGG